MAASSFFALIDDIAAILDDVAVLSKVAAKKTAGVLGDDLALNAQQVSGVQADRELPVVWAVAKGSMVNKAILVPSALAISAILPAAITPLLMAGGVYLCFEGFEKLYHHYAERAEEAQHQAELIEALSDESVDLVALEQEKIKGAIRTDFILSAEIIVIALGTVAAMPFVQQVGTLITVAVLMTVGVYGLVAGIVKLDDAGLYLSQRGAALSKLVGRILLAAAPMLMKALSVLGTVAMFMVGGSILGHGLPFMHGVPESAALASGPWLGWAVPTAIDLVTGLLAGALALVAVLAFQRIKRSL
jgi:predicted DNA repair protein MutK